jgi:hypothetical protein
VPLPHAKYDKVVKSRRMRWVGHAACTRRREMHMHVFSRGKLREREHMEDLSIDG